MIRKFAIVGALSVAALTGCATYGETAYGNGRGNYYYGYPSSSSVGVSVGSGYYGYPSYGYGYPNGYYSGYGYPSSYGYGYPSYGYPRYPVRPRPRPDGQVDRTPNRKPGWRDLDQIRRDAQGPRTGGRVQSVATPQRVERSSPPRGAYSGVTRRAVDGSKKRIPQEP